MKFNKVLILVPLLIFSLAFSSINKENVMVQSGAVLEKLSGDFAFTEGPTSDAAEMYILLISLTTG